jgi:hypothetical protein
MKETGCELKKKRKHDKEGKEKMVMLFRISQKCVVYTSNHSSMQQF